MQQPRRLARGLRCGRVNVSFVAILPPTPKSRRCRTPTYPSTPHARFPREEACHLRQALLLQLVSRKQTVVFKCRPTCNFFFCHTSIFLANKECQFLERANRCWGQMTVRKQENTALLFDAEMVELDEMGEVDSLQPLSWGTVFETACAARIQIYWDNWHEWWIMLAASRLVLPWTRGSEWNPFLFPWPGHMRRRSLVLSCVSKRRERSKKWSPDTIEATDNIYYMQHR